MAREGRDGRTVPSGPAIPTWQPGASTTPAAENERVAVALAALDAVAGCGALVVDSADGGALAKSQAHSPSLCTSSLAS